MQFYSREITTGFASRQVGGSITASAIVPRLIEQAGHDTKRRFVEFFAANIRNANTRSAYLRSILGFCDWCESRDLELHQIEPTMIAFYIEELLTAYAKPTVKQRLPAIRMLFDFFVYVKPT